MVEQDKTGRQPPPSSISSWPQGLCPLCCLHIPAEAFREHSSVLLINKPPLTGLQETQSRINKATCLCCEPSGISAASTRRRLPKAIRAAEQKQDIVPRRVRIRCATPIPSPPRTQLSQQVSAPLLFRPEILCQTQIRRTHNEKGRKEGKHVPVLVRPLPPPAPLHAPGQPGAPILVLRRGGHQPGDEPILTLCGHHRLRVARRHGRGSLRAGQLPHLAGLQVGDVSPAGSQWAMGLLQVQARGERVPVVPSPEEGVSGYLLLSRHLRQVHS